MSDDWGEPSRCIYRSDETDLQQLIYLFFDSDSVIWVHSIPLLPDGPRIGFEHNLVMSKLRVKPLHVLIGPCKNILVFCEQLDQLAA